MKKVDKIKLLVIGAAVLMLVMSTGPAVTSRINILTPEIPAKLELTEDSLHDVAVNGCSPCQPKRPDVIALKEALIQRYQSQDQTEQREPWTYGDCSISTDGNCKLCYQVTDHDGDEGPKPPEVHYWLYCNGELIWHIWCEDIDDPDSCICLDGCGSLETSENYHLIFDDM